MIDDLEGLRDEAIDEHLDELFEDVDEEVMDVEQTAFAARLRLGDDDE